MRRTCSSKDPWRTCTALPAGCAAATLLIEGDAGNGVAAEMSGGRVEVRGAVGDDAGAGDGRRRAAGERRRRRSSRRCTARGSEGHDRRRDRRARVGGRGRGSRLPPRPDRRDGRRRCRRRPQHDCWLARWSPAAAATARAASTSAGPSLPSAASNVPSTYRYACTFRPPHLRVTLTYLVRRYGLSFDRPLWCRAAIGGSAAI